MPFEMKPETRQDLLEMLSAAESTAVAIRQILGLSNADTLASRQATPTLRPDSSETGLPTKQGPRRVRPSKSEVGPVLLDALRSGPRTGDELLLAAKERGHLRDTARPDSGLRFSLLNLEKAGKVERLADGRWAIAGQGRLNAILDGANPRDALTAAAPQGSDDTDVFAAELFGPVDSRKQGE